MRPLIILLLGLCLPPLLASCSQEVPGGPVGPVLAKPPSGGDFTLRGVEGPVSTRDYRGKVLALYFGYTHCPDVCPTSLATLGKALSLLSPAEQAKVQPFFISVDPERETLAGLRDYATFFHPAFKGLTGSPQELQAATAAYGASYARQEVQSGGGYVVDHTSVVYLVAPDGHLAAALPHGSSPEEMIRAIRGLLAPGEK